MVVAPPPPPLVSYADNVHGWRAANDGVESTSDGGQHWRVVFRTPREVTTLARTSMSAGLVTFDAATTYATNDAGAHWHRMKVPVLDAVGRGALLFIAKGTLLLEATEWPLSDAALHAGVIHTRMLLSGDEFHLREALANGVVYDIVAPSGAVTSDTVYVEPPALSWADRDHGWRATDAGLEATDDGGHHWHLVLQTERTSGAEVGRAIRTSARSGLVGVSGRLFVTNDAGRHWYQVQGGPSSPSFGRGSLLFGTGGRTIDQAVQWPLKRLVCDGRWVHSAEYFNLLSPGPGPRTICIQDSGGPTIRMRAIWTVPPGHPNWEVFGRVLATDDQFEAEVYDETNDYSPVDVGSVTVSDGVATFSPR